MEFQLTKLVLSSITKFTFVFIFLYSNLDT